MTFGSREYGNETILYGPKQFILISHSCIKGILLEVNETLIKTPQLLVSKVCGNTYIILCCNDYNYSQQPLSDGYIAILLPKHTESNTVCSHLLDELQYKTIRT